MSHESLYQILTVAPGSTLLISSDSPIATFPDRSDALKVLKELQMGERSQDLGGRIIAGFWLVVFTVGLFWLLWALKDQWRWIG